jgi:hypothetical protein
MVRLNLHRVVGGRLMIVVVCLVLGTWSAWAFYNPTSGRWLSRDPMGEPGDGSLERQWPTTHQMRSAGERRGSLDPYVFAENTSVSRFDVLGLFGDGGGGPWSDNSGHADFVNFTICRFNYTKEDKFPTWPYPIIGQPGRHFRDLPDSEGDLQRAVESCSKKAFERAMHRAQDYFVHFAKGYRWDPGNSSLPCNGWGHACDGTKPDHDAAAWNDANNLTDAWLNRWLANCCVKCGTCKWIKRSVGPCGN